MKKLTLNVTTVLTDNQDGGYSLRFFKDEATAKEKIASRRCKKIENINWDDEYENGYFSSKSINLVEIDGELQLEKELYFHFGQ